MPNAAAGGEDTAQQTITMEVAEISVLNLSGSPGKLTVFPPQSAGQEPQNAIDGNTFIQYSSTVGFNQQRMLTVRWDLSDAAPTGCVLKLRAEPSGKPNEGSSSGEIILSQDNQTLISGIQSCATGIGAGDGARLFYTLTVIDASLLSPGETQTVTITLTLTDVS